MTSNQKAKHSGTSAKVERYLAKMIGATVHG